MKHYSQSNTKMSVTYAKMTDTQQEEGQQQQNVEVEDPAHIRWSPTGIDYKTSLPIRVGQNAPSWVCHFRIPINLSILNQVNYATLLGLCPKERKQVIIGGASVTLPRYIMPLWKPYNFSGLHHPPYDGQVPASIIELLDWCNSQIVHWLPHNDLGHFGAHVMDCKFNSALINWYMDGSQSIGPHSDKITGLIPGAPIITVSFGTTRRFRVRHKDADESQVFMMGHGTAIVMGGRMQQHYTHEVPKSVDDTPRVSITFRCMA